MHIPCYPLGTAHRAPGALSNRIACAAPTAFRSIDAVFRFFVTSKKSKRQFVPTASDRTGRDSDCPYRHRPDHRNDLPGGRNEARAFYGRRALRVFGEAGNFLRHLDPSRDTAEIRRLLAAPNAERLCKHGGELVGIRLLSVGDDRGQAESHGKSTITTERGRNDRGVYIGADWNLKHKENLSNVEQVQL
jgi:hypothetical protein